MSDDSNGDSSQELWCMLTLDSQTTSEMMYVARYEIGLGNSEELLEMESMEISHPTEERNVLRAISIVLENYRDRARTIITPTYWELRFLRTRFLATEGVILPPLAEYKLAVLHDLLDQYFITASPRTATVSACSDGRSRLLSDGSGPMFSIESVSQLWSMRVAVEEMVPRNALTGDTR